MEHMAASCPNLRQLVLSNLTAPIGPLFQPLTQLHTLSLDNALLEAPALDSLRHLHGLSSLEIISKSSGGFLRGIAPLVQQLSALASLSLVMASPRVQDPTLRDLSEFSRLGALLHLTHLKLDRSPFKRQALDSGNAVHLAQYLPRLVRLELSCFELSRDGAAEALAELQHLTQLSVWNLGSLGPMDDGPPCSWKELTLCGEEHWLEWLTELPLRSLERIRMGSGALNLMLPTARGDEWEMPDYIDNLRGSAALLASKLGGAGNGFGAEEAGLILKLQPKQVAAPGLFAALRPLIDVFHTLDLELHMLQDSHVRELGEALPHLRRLVLRTKDLSVSAWACLGAALPGLEMLILSSDEESFRPEHIAHLASSLSHPLVIAVDGGGVATALAGLRALLAVRHAGAGFITLKERLLPIETAGDPEAAWRDVCIPNVMLDWWCAK